MVGTSICAWCDGTGLEYSTAAAVARVEAETALRVLRDGWVGPAGF
jgi:hypothetical protein